MVIGILFALFFAQVGKSQISINPPVTTNVIIECDGVPNDPPTIIANYNNNFTVVNNCAAVTWTNNFTGIVGGTCAGTGIASVTYTVDDGCNTDNVTINFTVVDNTPPNIITNPSNPIIQCDSFSIGDYTSWLNAHGGAVAEDVCSSIDNTAGSSDWSHTASFSPSCPTTGTYNVTFTVADDCGNTSSVGATFSIIDTNPPVIDPMASDLTEACGEDDDQSILQSWINNRGGAIATEGCSAPTWINFSYATNDAIPQTGIVAFGDFPNYPQVPANNCNWSVTVVFNVSDFCGNINSTTANFSVEDTTPPTVVAPADVTTECDNVPEVGTPMVTDLCDTSFDITIDADTTVGACPHTIVITRTWTATDDCGNTGMDNQVITVQDNNAPTFDLPADVTVECDEVGNMTLTGSPSSVVDNCDANPIIDFSDATVAGGCSNSYTLERTWTATDACGNMSSQTQLISVQDLTKPIFVNLPQSTTITCVDDASSDAAYDDWLNNFGGGTATDNCGAITWLTLEPGSYDVDDANTFTTPALGLSSASCPSLVQGIYRTKDVSFVAVDECGNAVDTTVTFSVVDDTPPVFVDCPIDVTLNNDSGICGADFILSYPFITDNCNSNVTTAPNGLIYEYSVNGGTRVQVPVETDVPYTFGVGENQVTYFATDCAGNLDSCNYTVTILDDEPPTIDCPADLTVSLPDTADCAVGTAVDLIPPTNMTDNCGLQSDDNNISITGNSSTTITYFATGATTIPDSTFPVPLTPVSHIFKVGTTTVTYQVEDVNGNASTCSYEIAIEDNIAPTAMCQDTTIYVSPDGGSYILDPSEVDSGSSDNCGIVARSVFPNTFTCADVGTTVEVVLEVTDAASNTSACMASVAIQALELSPTFTVGACGNENLSLFANAPAGIYTYEWQGPNGFVSSDENPIIQNASINYSGTYIVQITGQSGCTSTGSITLAIDPAIDTPPISATATEVCANQFIELTTASYTGNGVNYHWYEGTAGSGNLLATTQIPSYTFINPLLGNYSYYVIVEADGCFSEASATTNVEVLEVPIIISISNNQVDCATGNEDMILTPLTAVPGNFTYQWTGPNGFTSSSPEAILTGVSASDNGMYTLVIVSSDGCASDPYTHIVNVDDLPPTPMIMTLDHQLCEGDTLQLQLNNNTYTGAMVSYDWQSPGQGIITTNAGSLTINNTSPSDSGNYTLTVTVDGCTSLPSEDFLVNINSTPPTPIPTSNAPVCEGENLQFTTDLIAGATYFWTGPNNFNSTIQNPTIFPAENIHEGEYSVAVEVNGCLSDVSLPLIVEVKNAPDPVEALNSGDICLDDPMATLDLMVSNGSALPFAIYTWYSLTNGNIVGGPTTDISVTVPDLITYGVGTHGFYVVAEVEGCLSLPSDPTFVEFNDVPNNNAFAGADIFVCDDSSVDLDAQAPAIGAGVWSQTSGLPVTITNPDAANTSIVGLEVGEVYTFAWTLSNGACNNYSTDEITVTVDGLMALAQAGDDVELCEVTTLNLNATPVGVGFTGTWTQPAFQQSLGVQIVNANDPNTTITGLILDNTFQFIWTVSNQGCGDFASDIIVVTTESTQGIEAFAGVDLIICGEEEALLNGEDPPSNFEGTWTTTSNASISQPNQFNTLVFDLEVGENIFTWTLNSDICGDFSTDEVVLFYQPTPVANDDSFEISFNGTLDFEVLPNDSIVGDHTLLFSNPTHGTLEENDGIFTYVPDLVFVGTDQFEYEICSVICSEECSTATVTLNVGQDVPCEVPTIFTPNNDGINDEFLIPCFGTGDYPENIVSIFNQWGDEVYRQTNYQNNWRGTFNGNDLPVGTYFFIVDFGNGLKPTSGFLVLER